MDVITYALLKKQMAALSTKYGSLAEGFSYKGSVASTAALPATDNTAGDLYTVTGEGNARYLYDGEEWVNLDSDITDIKNAIDQKADKTTYVTLSGTQVTQVGADNTMYLCGELAELTFTAPATGITAIRFTSGTTPTVVTLNGITMPDDWTGAKASTTYEINVLNGLGVWQAWI